MDKKARSSKRNFILALILLLLTNTLMGVILMTFSKKALREQIDQRMLDIANTAAYQLNGDELKNLTAEDEDTEEYQRALETLRSFQDNIDLDYIYGIKAMDDGTFTFTIDPAVDDPGEFGSPIKTTDALKNAAGGTPDVDKKPYSDEWGRFYSAYSPVFDSDNNVVGIVGVDFNAKWLEGKVNSHKAAAVIITMLALTIGIVLSFIILSQNRRRFSEMLKKLGVLDKEAQKLNDIIMKSSIKKLDLLPDSKSELLKTLASGEENKQSHPDEYSKIYTSIDSVCAKLGKYLKYVESEVDTDPTTGVRNKVSYKAEIKKLDETISEGKGDFAVAFFDINSIKEVFIHEGFEAGDVMLFECAQLLRKVFGKNCVYHVTGDEFIILAEDKKGFEIEEDFAKFDEEIKNYNSDKEGRHKLSVAKGAAVYNAEKHSSYRKVFIEAKAECDKDKAAYYKRNTISTE